MPVIATLVGSARASSLNLRLAQALVLLAPPSTTLDVHTIAGVPVYDGDVEAAEGVPAVVRALKEAVASADGLLLVSPEYNQSLPGAFKNAIDWLSRPPADAARVFRGKPVAVCGATPGPTGTRLAQAAWLPVLRALETASYFGGQLAVERAAQSLGEGGELLDANVRERARRFVAGFAEFVAARAAAAPP